MLRFSCILALVSLVFSGTASRAVAQADVFDLVVVNARIVDGTGNPWFYGSVGIKDGRIVKIGRIDAPKANRVIDAQNQIVAPGFIDVHGHTEDIYNNPKAENFIRMGVTTVVTGNCGGSSLDIGAFLGKINETPLAVNISSLIGHNTVRQNVLGLADRAPSQAEQQRMNDLVDKAMKDGAVGFATGLIYLPGTFAKTEEVVELATVASKHGGIYASHIRNEANQVVEAIEEAINIGEKAKMPVEISHFKIASRALWGQTAKTIGLVEAARRRGVSVTVDQYAYPASSTSLDSRLPNWLVEGGREEGKKRLTDPANRKKAAEDIKKDLKEKKFKDLSYAYVAAYRVEPKYNGKNIREIAKLERGKDGLDDQIEQFLQMYEKGGAQMVYQAMDETDVQAIMKQPFTMIASDSGVRTFGAGVPHPRGYGNNARVLGRYVRELKTISLEDAIRKMTSLPAQTFRFSDRGLIRPGAIADLVIFDENTVGDKATFEQPHQYAVGFSSVIVNGSVVFDGQQMTGAMPGQAIYGPGKTK